MFCWNTRSFRLRCTKGDGRWKTQLRESTMAHRWLRESAWNAWVQVEVFWAALTFSMCLCVLKLFNWNPARREQKSEASRSHSVDFAGTHTSGMQPRRQSRLNVFTPHAWGRWAAYLTHMHYCCFLHGHCCRDRGQHQTTPNPFSKYAWSRSLDAGTMPLFLLGVKILNQKLVFVRAQTMLLRSTWQILRVKNLESATETRNTMQESCHRK